MTDNEEPEPIFSCSNCGRNFIQSSLVKHEPACKKIQKMHRKVFDSGKQRATGSDVPITDVRKAQKEKEKYGGIFPRPKTNWRERHEQFISSVSASKDVKEALKTGAPLPPPPRTSMPSDYIRCDYCNRAFNDRAFDRHVAFCKEQNSRNGISNKAAAAAPLRSLSSSRPSSITSTKSKMSTRGGADTPKPTLRNVPTSSEKKLPASSSSSAQNHSQQHKSTPAAAAHDTNPNSTTTRANRPPSRRSSRDRSLANAGQQDKSGTALKQQNTSQSRYTTPNAKLYINEKSANIDSVSSSHEKKTSEQTTSSTTRSANTRSTSQSRLKTPKQVAVHRR